MPPTTWADPVHLWADDVVAEWTRGVWEADLTDRIEPDGMYRLRFASQSPEPPHIDRVEMLVGAVPRPDLARQDSGRDDVILLTAPSSATPITLRVVLVGGGGHVLLRRL